jgi:hypothetical protein
VSLLDARPLKLVRRFHVHTKLRGRSLYWHKIDMRPCLCKTLHGHCWAVACPCGRHEGEIN